MTLHFSLYIPSSATSRVPNCSGVWPPEYCECWRLLSSLSVRYCRSEAADQGGQGRGPIWRYFLWPGLARLNSNRHSPPPSHKVEQKRGRQYEPQTELELPLILCELDQFNSLYKREIALFFKYISSINHDFENFQVLCGIVDASRNLSIGLMTVKIRFVSKSLRVNVEMCILCILQNRNWDKSNSSQCFKSGSTETNDTKY